MSDRPADRPAHIITPDEVDAWLADSAVKVVTVHRTDPGSARDITEQGVDIGKTSTDAGWGQGFYSGTLPDIQYGAASVRVAVRLSQPLIIRDSIRDVGILEELQREAGTADPREAVLGAGYDGVVIHFGPGDMWVVAYSNDQVKVVLESSSRE